MELEKSQTWKNLESSLSQEAVAYCEYTFYGQQAAKDGYKQINAKNTLLATGGYAANPVMMRALQPAAVACCTASSFNPTCTGDGIRAGLWAGASKDIDAAPMIFDRGAVAPGVDAGYEGTDEAAVFRGNIFQEIGRAHV